MSTRTAAVTQAPSLVAGRAVENRPERVLQNDLPLNCVSSCTLGKAVVAQFCLPGLVSGLDMAGVYANRR